MDNADLLDVVKEDLLYLDTLYKGSPEDADIKRTSVTLRRLLIEGIIYKAWHLAGFQDKILITTLKNSVYSHTGSPYISIKGGATTNGLQIADVSIYNRALSDEEIKKLSEMAPVETSISLGKYLEESCICIDTSTISNANLIKYFANRLGGVHIDTKAPQEYIYKLMDNYKKKYFLSKNESLHYQLLSIGQDFINSADIQKLLNYVRNKA